MLNDDVLLTIIKENFDRLDNSLNKSIGYKGIIDTNLNDCIETGFYSVKVGTENIPINEDSFLMVYNESTSLVQLWYSSTSDRQRIRRKNNDTWGDWYIVYTEKEPQDLSAYAPINAPDFEGSISLDRKSGTVVGKRSIAIGYNTEATDNNTQAFGYQTKALATGSHAEGNTTIANARYSHTEGYRTIASGENQHVQGKYNIEDTTSTYAHIVGNGTSDTARNNAHTLDWNGNAWFKGNVSVNGTPTNDNDLVTKKYVDDNEFSGSYNDLVDKPTIPTSLPANGGNADTVGGYSIWTGTQTEYDALGTYSDTTIYMIKEG